MAKTKSLWGEPPSRYYRFLKKLQETEKCGSKYTLAVLGCADGKFVLPAARKGMSVLAIDLDGIALYGGKKEGVGGLVNMPGLTSRLVDEGVNSFVEVKHEDFTNVRPAKCSGVWVSGAIQYSNNSNLKASDIISKVLGFVAPAGLVYIDYMLPYEDKYKGRLNCPTQEWWRNYVSSLSTWEVLSHRVMPPTLDLAHVEFPVDHYHQWGHLFMKRKR